MAVDGNWNIVMSTPMGERKATLTLKSAGGTLTGTQGADGNSGRNFDGTVSGDDVAWKISITNPMPLTLAFTGKVSGDSMSGEMGIGPMGSFRSRGQGPEPSPHALSIAPSQWPGRCSARQYHSGRAAAACRVARMLFQVVREPPCERPCSSISRFACLARGLPTSICAALDGDRISRF